MSVARVKAGAPPRQSASAGRPVVRGKFLFVGDQKFWVRGISYGTFLSDAEGVEQLLPDAVRRDFAQMAENGFNVVRTYTAPPRWLLDEAMRNGLRVMVGFNWGDQMAFLDDPGKARDIEGRVRGWVRGCAGHPAVFCYSVGNEIPSSIVRWHGRRRVERFLRRLYQVVKDEDPDALVTYVNYPTTEYLRLPFLDFVCFNVYLESQRPLADYIARLHSLSDDRPLLLAEVGLDSLRNGESKQADVLDWQVRTAFRHACCGAIVFAWTDEWYHGTFLVEDWAFGLTTRDRTPKPALHAVRRAFAESPFPPGVRWPMISVVVCSFNGASTIRETLDALDRLDYPEFEVIVVDDGSTDSTPQIASEYAVRLISTKNHGLSHARNVGIGAAKGEIVAFIDDDAYPDPDWLRFLALPFAEEACVGVGGPNLPPRGDGWKAEAIANAPGGPNPVLLSDTIAEHIPGCNMAFRKDALDAIGGFDAIFRAAGDDVDLCWRLHDRGGVIRFAPGAMVWHHRRKTISRYWKQQVGYGKAESLLERKWPSKYNAAGQLAWLGRIYGRGVALDLGSLGGRVYQGVWGTAPFQSLYQSSNSIWSLTLMPEWYLIVGLMALLYGLGFGWGPDLVFGPLLVAGIAFPIANAWIGARRAKSLGNGPETRTRVLRREGTVFVLHFLQPIARLRGRLRGGLAPWRRRGAPTRPCYRGTTMSLWRNEREAPEVTLGRVQSLLRSAGAIVRAGGVFDGWDIEVNGGFLGGSRLLLAIEEHAPEKQFLRFGISPRFSRHGLGLAFLFTGMSVAAALSGIWVSSAVSAALGAFVFLRVVGDAGVAGGLLRDSLLRFGAS